MRLVAVSDTHTYHRSLVVPDGDIFIHAGDLCAGGAYHELRAASEWVMSLPHAHKVIISGNHDWPFVNQTEEAQGLFSGATYLQDREAQVAGLRFYGSPWQPRFFDWAFNLNRDGKELWRVWEQIPHGLDVLVTHGPPHGYGDVCFGDHAGCKLLLNRIRKTKPRLHLFGHIHEDGGTWTEEGTTFVNVTTNECRRGATVIDVEPTTMDVQVHLPPKRRR